MENYLEERIRETCVMLSQYTESHPNLVNVWMARLQEQVNKLNETMMQVPCAIQIFKNENDLSYKTIALIRIFFSR